MTIDFYTSHIETLADLQVLAKKHNCKLSFGISSKPMNAEDVDEYLLTKHFKCPEDIAKEICDKCSFEIFSCGDAFSIYFELKDYTDERHPIYNILTNVICEFSFKVQVYDELSEKAIEWLRDNSMNDDWGLDEDDGFIMWDNHTEEEVTGFKDVKKEGWCYRTGMILSVFTQLVCDYLGEERIERTY